MVSFTDVPGNEHKLSIKSYLANYGIIKSEKITPRVRFYDLYINIV